ncbi:MAG: SGNH/GDSL hydrolase family protein [Mycobacteriales bacterium]
MRSVRHPARDATIFFVAAAVTRQVVGVLGLRRSISHRADFWQRVATEQGELLLVVLGDSVAQGIGASRPELGCVGLISQRLALAAGRSVRTVNLSRTGAGIVDVLNRQLPALRVLEQVPDLVLVEIGANDMIRGDLEPFLVRLDDLLDALPPHAVIADVAYLMHGRWERDAQRAAAVLTERAQARGFAVVPIHAALSRFGPLVMLSHVAADLFHPNDRGHRVWADSFWQALVRTGAVDRLVSGARSPG